MSLASTAGSLSSLSADAKAMLISSARAEELAGEILWRKQHLVDLDRQRQECMQALAGFRKDAKGKEKSAVAGSASSPSAVASVPSSLHAPPSSKLWVSLSGNFVRLPRTHVQELLTTDRAKLDEEVESVRTEMKELMQQLQNVQQSLGIPKGLLDFALKDTPAATTKA